MREYERIKRGGRTGYDINEKEVLGSLSALSCARACVRISRTP
jgi:hypothetical protein